jgi:hypothetical protein
MKFFDVTIKATVTKTYTVQADDSDAAVEIAAADFSVLADGAEEHYEEEVLDIIELKRKKQMARFIFDSNNDEYVLRDEWGIDDVRNVIDTENIEEAEHFTNGDCLNVLRLVADGHDANVGVNWRVVSSAIDYYLESMTDGKPLTVKGVPLLYGDTLGVECSQSSDETN